MALCLDMEYCRLSRSLGMCQNTVKQTLVRLLDRYRYERENLMASLGPNSFPARWVHEVRS